MITSSELLAYMAIYFCNDKLIPCTHALLKDFGLVKYVQDLIDKEVVDRINVKGTYHYFICASIDTPVYGKEDFKVVEDKIRKFIENM